MTTPIFTEVFNSLNNRMCQQGRHIIMFLDNCSSHPHIKLSNIKLCFYPKNTTSWLQAMDQDVIATPKKKYAKHVLNAARIKSKSVQNITEIVNDIRIFDAILHAKVAWEAIDPETIVKFFRHSGIKEKYDNQTPPTTPNGQDLKDDDGFTEYFENLLDMPWDEYLAMDNQLESKEPRHFPDTLAYSNDDQDVDQDQDQDETPPIKADKALEQLLQIQKSKLGDTKLFDVLEQAMCMIQNKKTVTELT